MTFGRTLTERREQREAERERNLRSLCIPSKAIGRGVYTGSTAGAALKGEKAKPGKRAPTKEERAWMDAIVAYGCIACRIDAELVQGSDGVYRPVPSCVHHILRGGRRMGHLHTLPLCPGHHQDGTGIPGLIARHPYKTRFEAKYGTEAELLTRLQAALKGQQDAMDLVIGGLAQWVWF